MYKDHILSQTAETDIVVYKMLERPYKDSTDDYIEHLNVSNRRYGEHEISRDTLMSPFQGMIYSLNEKYITMLQKDPEFECVGDSPCYSIFNTEYVYGDNTIMVVEHGFHTFTEFQPAKYLADDWAISYSVVVECVIPAGTQYYDGVWVSEGDTLVRSLASERLEVRGIVYESKHSRTLPVEEPKYDDQVGIVK